MATPIEIPKVLVEKFMKYPRIILDKEPPGYWPIPLDQLRGNPFFEELIDDREFAETHQVVIMKR